MSPETVLTETEMMATLGDADAVDSNSDGDGEEEDEEDCRKVVSSPSPYRLGPANTHSNPALQ